MATETTTEKRILRLEKMLLDLLGKIAGIVHKLGQVAEDNARAAQPLPGLGSSTRYFVVTTDIPARSGSVLGKGAGTLQRVTYDPDTGVGTLAEANPDADPTPLYSGAPAGDGVPIVAGRLVIATLIDGKYNLIVDYC